MTSYENPCFLMSNQFTHDIDVNGKQYWTHWVNLSDPWTNKEPVCQLAVKLHTASRVRVYSFDDVIYVARNANGGQFVQEIMVNVIKGFLKVDKTKKCVLMQWFSDFACIMKGEDVIECWALRSETILFVT